MESWINEVRFSFRRLRKRPIYALLAVLTLALGVGGTAAVFSLVRGYLLGSLPYEKEAEIAIFWHTRSWSEAEFNFLRPEFPGFQRVAAYRTEDVTVGSGDGPLRLVPGIAASEELFEVLGVQPVIGPGFRPGDDRPGAQPVAVLSHGLWQELGGDPSIVGGTLRLDGVDRSVAGVMPAGFWFPDPTVRVWTTTPMRLDNRSGNYSFIGRMNPGTSIAAMNGPLSQITSRLADEYDYPEAWDPTLNPELTPLREYVLGPVRPALMATLAAMALILLIACANVAALMLGQVDGRSLELAVRGALGAQRERLVRQIVVEAVMVGVLSAIAGAAFALAGFQTLVSALPLGALAENARLDWGLLGAALAISLAASFLVVLLPALSIWRHDFARVLGGARTGGVRGRGGRLEQGLVVAQVALAVLMVAGAGLLIRSVGNLSAIDPGLDVEGVAVIDIALPANLQLEPKRQILGSALAELARLPGVRSVAATQKLPLRGSGDNWGISIVGRPDLEGTTTSFRMVTADYFETMGVRLAKGRDFQPADAREGGEPLVIINEAAAALYFAGSDPIGGMISTGFDNPERIIGVVENVSEGSLTDPPAPARYMLYEHVPYGPEMNTIVLRADRAAGAVALLEGARATLHRTAPGIAIQSTTTMEQVFNRAIGPARQIMALLSILGGLGLIMGAIGVYGVVSHFVIRRRRDWGIRIALGLQPASVIGDVMKRGQLLVMGGILLGLAIFLAMAKVLASFLHDVEIADPVALLGASLTLLFAGAIAAFIPARRAGKIDPARVLRDE